MAIFSYDDIVRKNDNQNFKERKIQYLNSFLKKDGSEVIVRFPYTSTAQFDFVSIHKTQVGEKFKNIFCLRESPKEPLEKCPLCSGKKLNGEAYESPKTRFFIKLIAYIKDESDNVQVVPCIWEQSAYSKGEPSRTVRTLAGLLKDYGNLQEVPCRITRSGQGLSTEYDITPVNPVVYNKEAFPIDFSEFDNFSLRGVGYTERTFEELQVLVETGELPTYKTTNDFVVDDATTTTYTGEWQSSKNTTNDSFTQQTQSVQQTAPRPARLPRQY